MKYWIGYLVAVIFAVIAWFLMQFAQAHTVLVDMIYPYISRMIITALAKWSSGGGLVWQKILLISIIIGVVLLVVLAFVFRWKVIRWIGWGLAVVSFVGMLNVGLYGLNAYASPLADDISLEVSDYTVAELHEAAVYFRDKANELATQVSRDGNGDVEFGTFEEMAEAAGEGFKVMTYDQAISVFAGSTEPVKEQKWFCKKGDSGMTVALTGEAAVNPDVPEVSMPFAMCKEMAHRMCIYSDVDGNFAAFLTASNNPSQNFQYSAYLMAYYYCYETLAAIPTSTAKASASQTDSGVNQLLANDLEDCRKFYGESSEETNNVVEEEPSEEEEEAVVTFSSYTSSTDLYVSWYIQNFIVPTHQEEEVPFNPYDSNQVDLGGIVNAPTAPAAG